LIEAPEQYAARFRKLYARWNPALWQEVVTRAVPELLDSGTIDPQTLDAYLRLSAEAIGNGALATGRDNLYHLLLLKKIPALLGALPDSARQIAKLTDAFNLCDAVSRQPAWVEPLLMRLLDAMSDLERLDPIVDGLAQLLDAGGATFSLQNPAALQLTVHTTARFGYFLPKTLRFIAPPLLEASGVTPTGVACASIYLPDRSGVLTFETLATLAPPEANPLPPDGLQPHTLTLQDFTLGPFGAAMIFSESQNIWVWTAKDTQ
jgi:hypothetical protein